MLKKSRKVVALGLAATVAFAGVAMATSADDNDAGVIGNVAPKKLPKLKYKPIALKLGVTNSNNWITGTQQNPETELIRLSKNIRVNLAKAPRCSEEFGNGTPVDFARDQCPPRSYLGGGNGEVTAPGPTPLPIEKIAVMNGPGKNEVQLVTESSALGAGAPTIPGKIVGANKRGYGKALRVNAPETGALLITKFQATLLKARRVVTARCKPRKIKFQRNVTYKDGSSESVTKTMRCKVKR